MSVVYTRTHTEEASDRVALDTRLKGVQANTRSRVEAAMSREARSPDTCRARHQPRDDEQGRWKQCCLAKPIGQALGPQGGGWPGTQR